MSKQRPMEQWQIAVLRFATAILHGDEIHRAWLLEAAEKFIRGEAVPPPRDAKSLTTGQRP